MTSPSRPNRLRRLPLVLLLLGLLAPQAVRAQRSSDVFPGAEWAHWTSAEEAGYSAAKLQEAIEYAKTLNTTAYMVVVGGKVLQEYGDVTTVSYIASVRKSFLAMMYGNYVEKGIIRLDATLEELGMDDVGGLLPIERRARVQDLITARSGVYHQASNSGDDTQYAPERGSVEPGTYQLYNNWDFNAAGGVFEKMTGQNIYDALQKDIVVPIGMQDFDRSTHRKSGNARRSQYLAYHMNFSTRDMARFGLLMLRGGVWAGKRLEPEGWSQRITSAYTPVTEMHPESRQSGSFGYGYMWWVWDGPAATGAFRGAFTGRGAYGQFITVLPAMDMVVAHKTLPRRGVDVTFEQYIPLLEKIIAARESPPGPRD